MTDDTMVSFRLLALMLAHGKTIDGLVETMGISESDIRAARRSTRVPFATYRNFTLAVTGVPALRYRGACPTAL